MEIPEFSVDDKDMNIANITVLWAMFRTEGNVLTFN